jgi:hypothetical protein
MDKAISYNDFQKALQKPIKTLSALEDILTSRIELYIQCETIYKVYDIIDYEDEFATDAIIDHLYERLDNFISEMRKKDKRFNLNLEYDNRDAFDFVEKSGRLRKNDEDLLRRTRQAISALQRYPNLLFMAYTLKDNGAPVDDLEKDLEKTNEELATINPLVYDTKPGAPQCFDIAPLNSTDSDLQKLNAFLAYYPRQVEKIELWLRAHTPELTFKNAQQFLITPLTLKQLKQTINDSNESYQKGYEKGFKKGQKKAIKDLKKQRGPLRKSGGGKKPTFDILELQCEAFNNLYTEHANWKPSVLANKILIATDWTKPEYKKDKPFLYTPGMTEKEKKVVRKNLINRFKTWRKRNGLNDPFPSK